MKKLVIMALVGLSSLPSHGISIMQINGKTFICNGSQSYINGKCWCNGKENNPIYSSNETKLCPFCDGSISQVVNYYPHDKLITSETSCDDQKTELFYKDQKIIDCTDNHNKCSNEDIKRLLKYIKARRAELIKPTQ